MNQTVKAMKHRLAFHSCRPWLIGMALLAIGGCNTLRTVAAPQPSFYSLDSAARAAPAAVPAGAAPTLIVNPPHAAAGELRLDTEIIRLQHEFATAPSRVRFTLRATLVDEKARRVLARREFDAAIPAASDDPRGGVVAANRAVQTVLENLAAFCAEAVRDRPKEK